MYILAPGRRGIYEEINIARVIHSGKNLFCNVGHICNLVQEFNGLVSKRVDRKISPFCYKNYLLL